MTWKTWVRIWSRGESGSETLWCRWHWLLILTSAADETPGMNLHAWLRWCSMIPNVHITVRQNGFRINVMRPAVNKGPRLWILSICLTCELIDGQALSFFVSYLYLLWPGEVWLSCRGAGVSWVDSCGPSCQRDICRVDSVGYCDGTQGLGSWNDQQGIKNGTIRMQRHTSIPIILICSHLKETE